MIFYQPQDKQLIWVVNQFLSRFLLLYFQPSNLGNTLNVIMMILIQAFQNHL